MLHFAAKPGAMKKKATLYYLITGTIMLAACSNESGKSSEPKEMTEEQLIKHGEYLTTIMDCNTCHSPKIMTEKGPMPDPNRMLSGHPGDSPLDLSGFDLSKTPLGPWIFAHGDFTAYAGPWGISYGANITPDITGIGNFTLENFHMAFQKGKFHGSADGRDLLPPMPWQNFSRLPADDVKAIFTYLTKKVQPVSNVPPSPSPPMIGTAAGSPSGT